MLLENKNAVIYGAGGSIGGTVAKEFACEGQATIREFDGRGHQFDDDLSEVARDIERI